MPIPLSPALDTETPPDRRSKDRGRLELPFTVLDATCFKMAEKAALVTLHRYADASGWCWPKIDEIAARMGCDAKTARAAIHSLEERGLVRIKPSRDSSYYRIYPEHLASYISASSPTGNGRPSPTENGNASVSALPETGGLDTDEAPALPKTAPLPSRKREGSPTGNGRPSPTENGRQKVTQGRYVKKVTQEGTTDSLAPLSQEVAPHKTENKNPRADKPPPDPRVSEVKLRVEQLQGYPFATAGIVGEMVAIKRMLIHAEPDQIVGCWKVMRSEGWRNGNIKMTTVEQQLGAYLTGQLTATSTARAASAANGTGPPQREYQRPTNELHFRILNVPDRPAEGGGPAP